jgi:hypothetical protein
LDEAYHVEDQGHDEDLIEESILLHEDERLVHAPPFNEDESIQASVSPSHEDKGMVSCTPFQVFDIFDASLMIWKAKSF